MGAEEKLADREHGVERGRILERPVRVAVDLAEGEQPPDQVEGCRLVTDSGQHRTAGRLMADRVA